MNVNDLTREDRAKLIIIFGQFRATDIENDYRGYAHRDLLEQKLRDSGELDQHDLHLLCVAVCCDVEVDRRMRDHFCSILRQE